MPTAPAPSPAYARVDVDPLSHRIARGILLTQTEVAIVQALRVNLGVSYTEHSVETAVERAVGEALNRRVRVTVNAHGTGGTVELVYHGQGRKQLGALHLYADVTAVAS